METKMKFNFLKATAAFVVILSLQITPVSAALITDTATIGNKDWAHVNLFSNLSWNQLNTQCPAGVCGSSSTLNGWDMDGWSWASIDEIKTLFQTITGQISGITGTYYLAEVGSSWGSQYANLFGGIDYGNGIITVGGLGSTQRNAGNAIFSSLQEAVNPAGADFLRSNANWFSKDLRAGFSGAWMYRSAANTVAVPEPSTLAILALGLIGLAARRFKKQS
jgi:hypothetical protein